ncbi:MAG: alpha/beta hydrolase, partial [Flavobacteriaceae bacterium]
MIRLKCSFFTCLISIFGLVAQEHTIAIGQTKTIDSEILDEARQIAVFTPSEYDNGDEKYPVLYVLDGEWNFHYISGLVDKLSAAGDMPRTIVIGIINTNRNRDLTPPEANSNPNRFGGGEKFLDFISNELQPWVNENYRTQPFNILAGHSFGGLFTIYAMMEQPGLFQSYIALSPSLGRNNEKQLAVAQSFFSSSAVMPHDLYVALANEGGFTKSSTLKFIEVAKAKVAQKGRFKFEQLPDEDHFSIPVPGFLNGLRFIFEGMNPEKLSGLDEIFLIEAHF